jgi:hypothetical protein
MCPSSDQTLTEAVAGLQAIYGPPNQSGFGSAVFADLTQSGTDLEPIARRYYQHFVGPLWTETDDQTRAQQALATVFNHPQVTNLSVYAIGDGSAMSGLLLAGSRTSGETTILVSLLD